ncbi:MAG: glycerol-3-phosphate 1-O-acyltransferase PlsY [Clostridiales bacterium]|jgi:glycerol-3-phosphate acyltransferase PlsY|nr:glycerol-3-phosphate 1-O-acyltransferase PlsY [Clostridiales bacterium]
MKKTDKVFFGLGFASALFLALSFLVTVKGEPVYFLGFTTGYLKAALPEGSVWYLVINVITVLVCIAASYFAGSMNFAIMVSREKYGDDVRNHGSGNAGMTNMFRVYGKKAGLLTLLGDALKTSSVVLMGRFFAGEFGAFLTGLFCVLGHIAPVWYKFKGGKGVVASAIAILIINPLYFVVEFLVFAFVYLTTHYVSLSSVVAAFIYPAVVFYGAKVRFGGDANPPAPAMIFAAFVGLLIILKHRANMKRLYYNQEKKTYFFKKSKKEGKE